MDKTRDSTNSKIWPDSTCAIGVRRKGQILLVVESLVLSTTFSQYRKFLNQTRGSQFHPKRNGQVLSLQCKNSTVEKPD